MIEQQHRDGESWYAVHCQPLKESLAATALVEQLALTVYLPKVKCRRRGRVQFTPFFPRYLFVRADLRTVALNRINATIGVQRLVAFGEIPQPISASVIDALRQRVDHFNADGGLLRQGFQPGEAVRLTQGPLRGLEAIFGGPTNPGDRVRVLIEFLGRQRMAEVNAGGLERVAANSAAATKPPRRTRGKGRRINLKTDYRAP